VAGIVAPAASSPAGTAGIELHVERVSKSFGETRALSEVSLSVLPGSVHALVGENGAGKSTLGRIISGVTTPDSGAVFVDGSQVELRSPRAALERGIATIAQELALVPRLDAVANVMLGVERQTFGFVRRSRMRADYDELAASVGFDVPADRPVGSLSIAQQQEVEILRALSRDARLIVMDEPSARLSAGETKKLHRVIRRLAASGRSVLLISHFLSEVLSVADEVTVLRDGRVVRHASTAAESEASLIEAMLGRKLGAQFPPRRPPPPGAPVVLETRDLSGAGFAGVSLRVGAGEIVGLAGLVGAGRSELGRAIVGAAPFLGGRLLVNGEERRFRTPRQARSCGVLMLPESRRDQGLFLRRPTRENVSVASLERFSRLGLIAEAAEKRATAEVAGRAAVGASIEAPVSTLSGGNQQKVLFARTMLTRPVVLIADEPTRGVDVGAKRAIYEILVELAAEGMAILLISSEMEEILGLAHRVVVMRNGRVTADLPPEQISEEAILSAAFEARSNGGPPPSNGGPPPSNGGQAA
jgi:simple sugar transport system ATP-binding protein/ribose transport system ATP-binding protein